MNTHVRDNLSELRAGGVAVTSQAANDLVYALSATQLARIAAAANAVLVTNGSSVPSLSSTLPNAVQDLITRLGTIAAGAAFGTNPAAAGMLRIPNSQSLQARNTLNNGDVQLIGVDVADVIRIALGGQQTAFAGDVIIAATKRLYPDGGGDTYLVETSANQLDVVAGGVNTLRTTAALVSVLTGADLDVVDFLKLAVSGTTPGLNGAPHANAGYYGGGTNLLGSPSIWARVKNRATGTAYAIPLFAV